MRRIRLSFGLVTCIICRRLLQESGHFCIIMEGICGGYGYHLDLSRASFVTVCEESRDTFASAGMYMRRVRASIHKIVQRPPT